MANRPSSSTGELAGGWEPPPSASDDASWRSASEVGPFRALPEFSLPESDAEPGDAAAAAPRDPGASTVARAAAPTRTTPAGPPAEVWPGDDVRFPRVGETLAGFRLVGVLGHGSFATVYLAEQVELGGRPVALKVARALGDEPRWLARLQHAHIVPIHSVHDDPRTGLRLLCMPYLGGANLAQVLETAAGLAPVQPTGRSLLKALDRLGRRAEGSNAVAPSPPPPASPAEARSRIASYLASLAGRRPAPGTTAEAVDPRDEPARAFYRGNAFPRAAVYIAARLAEALDHAHQRGILHRDLKPSNVLIAADGTPMLLDFNLSEATAPDPDRPARVGGTLPYMAPEHLRAFHPATRPGEVVVDARSDLYALGLILYEMLAGRPPFTEPDPSLPIAETLDRMIAERQGPPPSPRAANPDVSPGLDSIVRTCLAHDPDRRHPDAATLAEDLRRHLDDRPLAFAPEPSLRERLAKWLRRHPEARSSSTIGTVALALLLALGAAGWAVADRLATASARVQFEEFQRHFRACQLRLNTTHGPTDGLEESLALADRALAAYGLDASGRPDRSIDRIDRLSASDRRLLREQLAELLILRARAGVARARLAGPGPLAAALRAGIADLDRAKAIDPEPPATLYRERQAMADLLDRPEDAARDAARAEALPARTARDFYLEGTVLAAHGRLDEAEARLVRAVTLDPARFWAWFALGLCRFDQARYAEAEADFRACTLLAPDFAWPHLNRGLALARAGRLDEARAAYDRAVELDPTLVEARVNRALVALELGDVAVAEADLAAAAATRPRDAAILAAHGEALARLGRRDEAEARFAAAIAAAPSAPAPLVARGFARVGRDDAGARRDLEAALRLDPTSARAHLGLAHLDRHSHPDRALAQLDAALALDPNLLDAVQLRALLRARQGDPAAEADVDRLLDTPTPLGLYNAACALALLGDRAADAALLRRARVTLDRAIARGVDEAAARADPDLAPLFRD
jgi:serine/threonine protein kinase/tetratricopeptide (TPR) repeat protein